MAVRSFRIGGSGVFSEKYVADRAEERESLIERYLDDHVNAVMFLEVNRDDRSWDAWEADQRETEFLRVGVNGRVGAAEYVFRRQGSPTDIRATHNPSPDESGPPVPYDDHAPLHFPADTVVPLGTVRSLMVTYALTGEWSDAVGYRAHDHLIA